MSGRKISHQGISHQETLHGSNSPTDENQNAPEDPVPLSEKDLGLDQRPKPRWWVGLKIYHQRQRVKNNPQK